MATRFRLATLLKIREQERDHAGKAVQEAQTAIDRVNQARQEIDVAYREMDDVRKEASNGALALSKLLDAQRYQMVLSAQAAHLEQNLATLQDELQRRQQMLIKRQQAVKSLEKLREQRAQAEEQFALSRFQERLDEWANNRVARLDGSTGPGGLDESMDSMDQIRNEP